jgi:hypothetical protein
LDLNEIKVWYRKEEEFNSVRCEYGGFIIKITHKMQEIENIIISYPDRKNFF